MAASGIDSEGEERGLRFPIELWAEEFEDRFSSICQSRIFEMIQRGRETAIDTLLEDTEQDLEALLRTAPPRLEPAFRTRARVIARQALIKTKEIFRDDPDIRSLINLSTHTWGPRPEGEDTSGSRPGKPL